MAELGLRQLRYLVVVADTRQISEAARRLDVAQSSLSEALVELEARLGVQLFERTSRGVELTSAGRIFVEKARTAIAAADDAVDAAQALNRAEAMELVVGYNPSPFSRWAPMFSRLLRENPRAQVHWRALPWPQAGHSPLGDADIGFVVEPPAYPGLQTLILERVPRVVVMAAKHPLAGREELAVADLVGETWPGMAPSIDPCWQGFWYLDEERGGRARVTDDRIGSPEQGFELVASGKAIATATSSAAAALSHPGIVAVPLSDARPAAVTLVWHNENGNALVERLVAIARERCGEPKSGGSE